MEMITERPKWPYKTPEELVRWIFSSAIKKITHHWRMTGNDTSEDWLLFHNEKGEERRMPTRFEAVYPEVRFDPDHARLIQLKGYPDVWETIRQIDAWEKANDHDRREYERLKVKFEG